LTVSFIELCPKLVLAAIIEFPVLAELSVGILTWVCPTLTAAVCFACMEAGDKGVGAVLSQIESAFCEGLINPLGLKYHTLPAPLAEPHQDGAGLGLKGLLPNPNPLPVGNSSLPPAWPAEMTFNFTLVAAGDDYPTVGSIAYSQPQQVLVQRFTSRNATAQFSGGDFHNCTAGASSFVWNVTSCQAVPAFQCSIPSDMFGAIISGVLLNNTVFSQTVTNTYVGYPSGAAGPLVVTYTVTDAGLPQALLIALTGNSTQVFNMTFGDVSVGPPSPTAFALPKVCPQSAPARGGGVAVAVE
jgi:hypothetical protein